MDTEGAEFGPKTIDENRKKCADLLLSLVPTQFGGWVSSEISIGRPNRPFRPQVTERSSIWLRLDDQ